MTVRSVQEVFADHLHLRKQGDLETDIRNNYAEDVVVMGPFGLFHGHDGVRQSGRLLQQQLPDRQYTSDQCLTDQEIAFERWDGSSQNIHVKNGIDFFLIRNSHIQMQLI